MNGMIVIKQSILLPKCIQLTKATVYYSVVFTVNNCIDSSHFLLFLYYPLSCIIQGICWYKMSLINIKYMSQVYKRKVYFCGQNCIQSFRTTRINPQFKKLPIQNFYSTAAKNSGPLALLYRRYNSKQLKLPDNYESSILFFNCKGDLIRTVPFQLKERVILFQFTNDEQLLIVYANGSYFIVDPATANITQASIFAQEQSKVQTKNRCFGAHLVGDKIIILRERVLGVVQTIGALWKGCQAIKINLDFPIFSGSLNLQGQLQIIYLNSSGSIELFNFNQWQKESTPPIQLYANPALKSNLPKLISIVKNQDRLGFIFADKAILSRVNSGTLVFPFNQFTIEKDDPVSKSQTKSKYRNFYQVGFMDNTLFFYDRVQLLFLSLTEPKYQIRHLSMTSLLCQSKIGLRLLDQHTFIFRIIHNAIYFNLVGQVGIGDKVLKLASEQQIKEYQHYKELVTMYQSFTEKKPIDIMALNQKQDFVSEVWELMIKVSSMYIDAGQQLMALKFANFIQNYFHFDKNTVMDNISKQLRVVNNLRHQYLNRWIAYDQFVTLKSSDQFLLLLLRYNMHFVADLIYEDSRSKQKIFSHWARCKIQKQTEATALEQIKSRYQQMKVAIGATYVFTDLARYCLDNKKRNLINLALQLIELEPHPSRRCVVFLFIFLNKKNPQTVDKLLEYAQQSNNTTTIHQTIQCLRRVSQDWLPPKAWLEILPKKPILQYHYIKILKSNNQLQELKEYFTMNGLFVQMSYMSLRKQLEKVQSTALEPVVELISKKYGKVLTSLSDQLQKCNRRDGVDILRELKNKKYPITEEDSNALTKDGEFQVLAEMIIKKDGNLPLAARVLRKMKSDKVYSLLIRKGKIKDAIEEAFARKNKEKMLELIPMADESMQELAKQLYQELVKPR